MSNCNNSFMAKIFGHKYNNIKICEVVESFKTNGLGIETVTRKTKLVQICKRCGEKLDIGEN